MRSAQEEMRDHTAQSHHPSFNKLDTRSLSPSSDTTESDDAGDSFFQPVAGASSSSTSSLLSKETSPATSNVEWVVPSVYLDRKAKIEGLKAISATFDTPASYKKPVEKSNTTERHWQHDLAEAYIKLQDVMCTRSKDLGNLVSGDNSQASASNKLLYRTPKITIIHQAIAFIENLLKENETLRADLLVASTSASSRAIGSKIEEKQSAGVISSEPSTSPSIPIHSNLSGVRPRLPLQSTTEADIPVPASLPGLPISSSPHTSITTPAQLASFQDDTIMQLCMPKGRVIPAHPAPFIPELPAPSDGRIDTSTIASSSTVPSVGTASYTSSVWSASTCPPASVHSYAKETSFTQNSGLQIPRTTPDESRSASKPTIVTEVQALHQVYQGFSATFPLTHSTQSTYASQIPGSNAKDFQQTPKLLELQGPTKLTKATTSDATSPGAGCQLAILNTPRRGSLPGDTSDGNTPNSAISDKIMHLPTMPQLKNIRIHTTTIRGRRQQRKLSNSGLGGALLTSLGENALGLCVNTSTPTVRRVASASGSLPSGNLAASGDVTAAKPEHNVIGSMDFIPNTRTTAYTSNYELPTPADDKQPQVSHQTPIREDCIKDLMLSDPTSHTTANMEEKATSPIAKVEDAQFVPNGMVAAAEVSPMQVDQDHAASSHSLPPTNQFVQQDTPLPRYDPLPGSEPVHREKQVPRTTQQQGYGYLPYPYSIVPASNTLQSYMPFIPGYPYSNWQQPAVAHQYSDWYATTTTHAAPKRKASPTSWESGNNNTANQAHQMPTHDPYYAMRQYYLGQGNRSYLAPLQQPYGATWDPAPMSAPTPVHHHQYQQQQQYFSSPHNVRQNSPQYDYYRQGMGSRVLDSIPENEIPAKRTRLE